MIAVGYAVLLGLPVFGLTLLNRAAILAWLETGVCPGGPMDRAAESCGILGIFWITVLGGWAAFLVVPLLAAWWAACTIGFLSVRKRL